ncbi:MAG: hypothetical protein LRS49_05915 [Desulfurococcales archaeon]|nr:hypothetical protein [Desulfurococcales archaeon]
MASEGGGGDGRPRPFIEASVTIVYPHLAYLYGSDIIENDILCIEPTENPENPIKQPPAVELFEDISSDDEVVRMATRDYSLGLRRTYVSVGKSAASFRKAGPPHSVRVLEIYCEKGQQDNRNAQSQQDKNEAEGQQEGQQDNRNAQKPRTCLESVRELLCNGGERDEINESCRLRAHCLDIALEVGYLLTMADSGLANFILEGVCRLHKALQKLPVQPPSRPGKPIIVAVEKETEKNDKKSLEFEVKEPPATVDSVIKCLERYSRLAQLIGVEGCDKHPQATNLQAGSRRQDENQDEERSCEAHSDGMLVVVALAQLKFKPEERYGSAEEALKSYAERELKPALEVIREIISRMRPNVNRASAVVLLSSRMLEGLPGAGRLSNRTIRQLLIDVLKGAPKGDGEKLAFEEVMVVIDDYSRISGAIESIISSDNTSNNKVKLHIVVAPIFDHSKAVIAQLLSTLKKSFTKARVDLAVLPETEVSYNTNVVAVKKADESNAHKGDDTKKSKKYKINKCINLARASGASNRKKDGSTSDGQKNTSKRLTTVAVIPADYILGGENG